MKKEEKIKNINEYKKRKQNRYRRRKIKKIIKPICIAAPIASIIILNLCGNAIVSNYKYKINSLKNDLRKEEIVLDGLKIKQLENSTYSNIEKNAKEKLNMSYPNENQKRYIDLNS